MKFLDWVLLAVVVVVLTVTIDDPPKQPWCRDPCPTFTTAPCTPGTTDKDGWHCNWLDDPNTNRNRP